MSTHITTGYCSMSGLRLARLLLLVLFAAFLGGCGVMLPREDHVSGPAVAPKVSATEVVFIHGMFVTPASWDGWLPVFEKAGFKVSAPAWPLHDVPVSRAQTPEHLKELGQLELAQVVDYYRTLLMDKPVKPIAVGHSMGGLVAQILLQEGLVQAAVAIDSAPPKGVLHLSWPFIKSNWGVINPLADLDAPIVLSLDQFAYAFAGQQTAQARQLAYASQVVPESRRIGKGPTLDIATVDAGKARGPLLLIAGGEDHIILAALNFKNFELYRKTPARTDFRLFEGRDHWLIAGPGWEEVAQFTLNWVRAQR
jgi:pimeloyl-ACP methyl ester carboxylesterase